MPVPPNDVREELMRELHRANERLHASKQEWEKWLGAPEFRHQERIDAAREALRAAEREVEAIEQKISRGLREIWAWRGAASTGGRAARLRGRPPAPRRSGPANGRKTLRLHRPRESARSSLRRGGDGCGNCSSRVHPCAACLRYSPHRA